MSWRIEKPELATLAKLIWAPTPKDNKYSRGILGVIAGSSAYPGAALLNISAAIHTGIGMIRYLGESDLVAKLMQSNPEVVLVDGHVDGYLIGSGIDPATRGTAIVDQISRALNTELPVVVDAGALDLARSGRKLQVLTPHAGELAKLLQQYGHQFSAKQIQEEPVRFVQLAAELLQTDVLLKGNTTYIAGFSQRLIYEISDLNPWLATAGSGDVLAGIIAALVVQQPDLSDLDFLNCIALGVRIHSMAAAQVSPGGPISANEIPQLISSVIAALLKNESGRPNL